MDSTNKRRLLHLIQIEKKAEEILVDKNDKIKLDMRRNLDRESIRALEKLKPNEKVWTLFGSDFVRLSSKEAKSMLEKDLMEANVEINTLHSDLKIKMNDLRDLEYEEEYKGFSLNPLSTSEMCVLNRTWGQRA